MNLEEVLGGRLKGVYRFRVAPAGIAMPEAAERPVVRVRTKTARDKLAFLKAAATALRFPDYFGQNWDAFYDCISGLAERSPDTLVIVFDDVSGFARVNPDEFGSAVDALRDAVEYWEGSDKRLIILLGVEEPLLATELVEVNVR